MKTAVEWLYDKIKHGITKKQFDEFILEAKEMEKEQIETAFQEGMFHHTNGLCPDEYYNRTFKSK